MHHLRTLERPVSLAVIAALVLGLVAAMVVLVSPGSDSAAGDVRPATAGQPVSFDAHSGLTVDSLLNDPVAGRQVAMLAAKAQSDREVAAYLEAVAQQRAAEAARQQAAAQKAAKRRAPSGGRSTGATGACGGDLPPCCVMMRESHGSPTAVNSSSGASGKWQFMPGTWNDYMGYPSAASAPAWVQDQKARQVYAGGAGAGHWAGPGC
jgi:hypothetical protein